MRILLDTHIFLWYISADNRLNKNHQKLILDINNDVFLSVASIWECIIKQEIGKLNLPNKAANYLSQKRIQHQINSLNIDENSIKIHGNKDSIEYELIQSEAEIGKPVRWIKKIKVSSTKENLEFSIDSVPNDATGVMIESTDQIRMVNTPKVGMQGVQSTNYESTFYVTSKTENVSYVNITYETSPPEKEETEIEEVWTDGGYVGEKAHEAAEENEVEHNMTAIKGRSKEEGKIGLEDFTIKQSEDGKVVEVICPGGESGEIKHGNKPGRYTAGFNAKKCAQCPFLNQCPVKKLKKKEICVQ